MDTADWILIIILVVICAIALVWFGAWLCKGSAPAPGPRVTGQGEAAKNAVRTAMSVFDYLRPRSRVAVGAAEYVGGVGEDGKWLVKVNAGWLKKTAAIDNDDVRHGVFLDAFKFNDPGVPYEQAVSKFNFDYAPPNVSTSPKALMFSYIDGVRDSATHWMKMHGLDSHKP